MKKIRVRNWERWQTYRKDRGQPPWIKLHRQLLRDHDWNSLSDGACGQLVKLWLLAADNGGEIPADPEFLARICYFSDPLNLEQLIACGFFDISTPEERHDDATVTPPRRRDDALEAEAEAETDTPPKSHPTPSARGRTSGKQACDKNNPVHANCRACGTNPRANGTNPTAGSKTTAKPSSIDEWFAWANGLGKGPRPGESEQQALQRVRKLWTDAHRAH